MTDTRAKFYRTVPHIGKSALPRDPKGVLRIRKNCFTRLKKALCPTDRSRINAEEADALEYWVLRKGSGVDWSIMAASAEGHFGQCQGNQRIPPGWMIQADNHRPSLQRAGRRSVDHPNRVHVPPNVHVCVRGEQPQSKLRDRPFIR